MMYHSLVYVQMVAPLDHLNLHTDLNPRAQIGGVNVTSIIEQRAKLHAHAAVLGGALVNLSELAQRAVRLVAMAEARLRVDVGHLAPDRAAGNLELGIARQRGCAGLEAEGLPRLLVIGRGAGDWELSAMEAGCEAGGLLIKLARKR